MASRGDTIQRGRGRGRGWVQRGRGGRGGGRGGWSSPRDDYAPLPPKPKGQLIDSINIKTLLIDQEAPGIDDVEYVASYNWKAGSSPVILVPGSPPAWTPPVTDSQLKPDSGDVFRDLDAARYPSFPLEPAIRSLTLMQPGFAVHSVDIFGCGSTLGNLLRAAGDKSTPFQFDVDVIGQSTFLIRKEKSPKELIKDVRGYGHTFPEAYTTWDFDVRESCSSQRVVHYDFGGLQVLIRTETDGYLPEAEKKVESSAINQEVLVEDIIANISIGHTEISEGQTLRVEEKGSMVPQNKIFDIKTRAVFNKFDMNDIIPRLWLNQTQNFLLAYHKFGLFDNPEITNVRDQISKWEMDNSSLLARFHALLSRIIETVRDNDKQQCEVTWDGSGTLLVNEHVGKGKRALPSDLVELWEKD